MAAIHTDLSAYTIKKEFTRCTCEAGGGEGHLACIVSLAEEFSTSNNGALEFILRLAKVAEEDFPGISNLTDRMQSSYRRLISGNLHVGFTLPAETRMPAGYRELPPIISGPACIAPK